MRPVWPTFPTIGFYIMICDEQREYACMLGTTRECTSGLLYKNININYRRQVLLGLMLQSQQVQYGNTKDAKTSDMRYLWHVPLRWVHNVMHIMSSLSTFTHKTNEDKSVNKVSKRNMINCVLEVQRFTQKLSMVFGSNHGITKWGFEQWGVSVCQQSNFVDSKFVGFFPSFIA